MKKILTIFCFLLFLFSAYQIYYYFVGEQENKKNNEKLIEMATSKNVDHFAKAEEVPIEINFSLLKQENQDIIGWIYSENTPIHYPVLQGKDNEYYLHRLSNGTYNDSGSIFMDYRNDPALTEEYTILYGHNRKNDTMFGTLTKYKDQKYYKEHKIMYFFTEKEQYQIALLAGFTVSDDSEIYRLSKISQDEKEEWIRKSDFKSKEKIVPEDKFIILSTCSYEYEKARYVLIGILKKLPHNN